MCMSFSYFSPPTNDAAYGGILGRPEYEFVGTTEALQNAGVRELMTRNKAMGGIMGNDTTYRQYRDQTAPMGMESIMVFERKSHI